MPDLMTINGLIKAAFCLSELRTRELHGLGSASAMYPEEWLDNFILNPKMAIKQHADYILNSITEKALAEYENVPEPKKKTSEASQPKGVLEETPSTFGWGTKYASALEMSDRCLDDLKRVLDKYQYLAEAKKEQKRKDHRVFDSEDDEAVDGPDYELARILKKRERKEEWIDEDKPKDTGLQDIPWFVDNE